MKTNHKISVYPLAIMGILLMFVLVFTAGAQEYNISFAANGGAASKLDSFRVVNVNQGTRLTLSGNDILHLCLSGTDGMESDPGILKVYPNPMRGEAEISFNAIENSNTQLVICDFIGKVILLTTNLLEKGYHEYLIKDIKQGIYVIKIVGSLYGHYVGSPCSECPTNFFDSKGVCSRHV